MRSFFLIIFLLFSTLFFSAFLNDVFAQESGFGQVIAHIYEDSNKNGLEDSGENGINSFNVRLYVGRDCIGRIHWYANTHPNGDALMGSFYPFIPVGEYSIDASPTFGWIATTPTCINVQINTSEIHKYSFGMFKAPTPNYYTQLDPNWGSQIYDHANSIGPFFCGSTIGECGCAVTSAVMLLTSYQVYNSPGGEITNPQVLDTWLKNRPHGYVYGGINWLEVAKYAYEANKVYDSPKIDFKGTIDFADFETLRTDLDSQKPVILQVNNRGSTHFVLAGSYLNDRYDIYDPLIEERNTTLDLYNNKFAGLRKYELTNTDLSAILLAIPAPGKIVITDSQGRRLGQDPNSGEIFKEIPGGNYYLEAPIGNFGNPDFPQVPEGTGTKFIEILDPVADSYTIKALGENEKAIFIAYDKDANEKSVSFDVDGSLGVDLNFNPSNINESTFEKSVKNVDIDIKPFDRKNIIQLRENIPIFISIIGAKDFDASEINTASVVFGPGNVKALYKYSFLWDVNRDGLKDLWLLFYPKLSGLKIGDTEACVSGKTSEGEDFRGCDIVVVRR